MGHVLFRDAVATELPALIAMYADDDIGTSREEPTDPLPEGYLRAFHAIDGDPRHRVIVGVQDGEIVATLQLSFIPQLTDVGSERAHIEAVRVVRDRRGVGIGSAMLTWAIERARERGCGTMQLTSNSARTEARRFYESLGFVASHVGMKLPLR